MARVRMATARCDGCGVTYEGALLDGVRCPRCYMGTLQNTAKIAADETPRPWDDSDDARSV